MARVKTQRKPACSQAGLRELRAALDAGDALAVVAALKARPKCPTIDGRQTFAMLVLLGDPKTYSEPGVGTFTARTQLGYVGLGPNCESCHKFVELLGTHPALAADSPQRQALLEVLDYRAETWR